MTLPENEWLNPANRWRNDGYFLFGKPPHIRNFITGREVSGRTKGFKEKEMNNVNRVEVRKWLFDHSNILGHTCKSIKSEDLDENGLSYNIAWIDTVTGERIEVIWEK